MIVHKILGTIHSFTSVIIHKLPTTIEIFRYVCKGNPALTGKIRGWVDQSSGALLAISPALVLTFLYEWIRSLNNEQNFVYYHY